MAATIRERHKLIHTNASASRRQIVEEIESYLRAHMDARLPVATLCRIAGLRERALRNAFYDVRGMSPKQWMLAVRLRSVQRALSDGTGTGATVTSIAIDHGFSELGRFAASYKDMFGEAPSATLRNASRRSSTAIGDLSLADADWRRSERTQEN